MPMSSTRRYATLFAALVAAACFALSVQGGRWWSAGEHGIGTTSGERCIDGDCERTTLAWTGGDEIWQRAGVATWAAGMVAMLVFVALAGALAAKRPGRLAAKVALIATVTAIVPGAVFLNGRPSMYGLAVDRGAFLFAAAIVAGLAAAISTLRARM